MAFTSFSGHLGDGKPPIRRMHRKKSATQASEVVEMLNDTISKVASWKTTGDGARESLQPMYGRQGIPRGDGVKKIIVPHNDALRARSIVSRSRARSTGKYPSWKMARMVEWESSHELNAFRLLDADPSVHSFQEQPLRIIFELDGETHAHYPDVLVHRGHRQELWEIKPAEHARDPFILARTQLLSSSLPNFGFSYSLVIGEELAAQPRLANVLTLLKHGRRPVEATSREHVRQLLLHVGHVCWLSAINGDLGSKGRAVLSRLTLEGVIRFDLSRLLAAETRFESALTKDVAK